MREKFDTSFSLAGRRKFENVNRKTGRAKEMQIDRMEQATHPVTSMREGLCNKGPLDWTGSCLRPFRSRQTSGQTRPLDGLRAGPICGRSGPNFVGILGSPFFSTESGF